MTTIMSGAFSESGQTSTLIDTMMEAKHNLTPEVNSIQSNRDFDRLEQDWRRLYRAVDNCSSPMKWEWMREWWRVFGNDSKFSLEILTVSIRGKITAILPLYYHSSNFFMPRSLRFLSTGEKLEEVTSPDYLDLLYEPTYLLRSISALFDHIFNHSSDKWDQLAFGILQQNSPLLTFRNASQSTNQRLTLRENNHLSMQAKLDEGFQSYLDSHPSSSGRQLLKRILKQFNSNMTFEVASGKEQSLFFFNEMTKIHQKRWRSAGMSGAFGSPRIINFHHSLIFKLASNNEVLLSRLCYKGATCAVLYGFINNGKYEFYQSGIDTLQKDIKSPGILAHLLNMKYLTEKQVTTYDFLCGESGYKERLSNSKIELKEIQLIKNNARSANSALLNISKRILGKFRHVLQ